MISRDDEGDLSGGADFGNKGDNRDMLEIEAERLMDNSSYSRADNKIDIEKALDDALNDESAVDDIPDAELSFDPPQPRPQGSVVRRLAVPVAILAIAAGAGGYLMLHPDMLHQKTIVPAATAAASPTGNIVLAEADSTDNALRPPSDKGDGAAAPALPAVATIPPPPTAAPTPADLTAPAAAPAPTQAAAVPAPAAAPDVKLAQADIPAAPPALSAPADEGKGGDMPRPPTPDMSQAKIGGHAAPLAPGQADLQPGQPVLPVPPGDAAAAAAALTPVPSDMGAKGESSIRTKSTVKKTANVDSNQYYDSNATLPSGKMSPAVGPRKVDPSKEPGQKLVVVSGIRKSTDMESMVVAADRAIKLEKYDAALDMYNTLYTKNPHDPRILMGRAVAQQHLGQNDAAIASYQEMLNITPGNADAMVNMLGLLKKKDPAGALQQMMALEDRFPADPGLAAQIGIAQGETGNYSEAMKYLGKAASLEPNNAQHPFNMAVLADRQSDTANAIKYYEQALQADSVNGGGTQTIPRETVYDRLATLRRR